MTMSKSTPSIARNIVHVAVAAVVNSQGKILISRRPKGVHLEGLWEFPGGKLEPKETVFAALQREMLEETGLAIETGRPLIQIEHEYSEKTVKLHTWLCQQWTGEARGLEGQEVRWVAFEDLTNFDFPDADVPIISALNLPSSYQISPEPTSDFKAFLLDLERCFQGGVKLFQLRAKSFSKTDQMILAESVTKLCAKYQVKWLLNGTGEDARAMQADGVHLDSHRLHQYKQRPLGKNYLVGASCHCLEDLIQAERLALDFAVLSPVNATLSHPDAEPIGLELFAKMIGEVNLPVYALGGMSEFDLDAVWTAGGQGVAMIRSGWPTII